MPTGTFLNLDAGSKELGHVTSPAKQPRVAAAQQFVRTAEPLAGRGSAAPNTVFPKSRRSTHPAKGLGLGPTSSGNGSALSRMAACGPLRPLLARTPSWPTPGWTSSAKHPEDCVGKSGACCAPPCAWPYPMVPIISRTNASDNHRGTATKPPALSQRCSTASPCSGEALSSITFATTSPDRTSTCSNPRSRTTTPNPNVPCCTRSDPLRPLHEKRCPFVLQ